MKVIIILGDAMNNLHILVYKEFVKNIDSLNEFLSYINEVINPSKIRLINNQIQEECYEDFISNLLFQVSTSDNRNVNINNSIVKSIIVDYINTILSRNKIKKLMEI